MKPLSPPPSTGNALFDRWLQLAYERIKASEGTTVTTTDGLTASQRTDLTDGGDSSAHYHSADRDLQNATGQLPASQVSGLTEYVQQFSALQDGDKGDITVSGAGSTWTIDNDAVTTAKIADDQVTYAKIQNVSATDKILGRSTAGSGNVEEIACTAAGRALLDDANAAAQRTTLGIDTDDSVTFGSVTASGALALISADRNGTGAGKYSLVRWATSSAPKYQLGIDGDLSDTEFTLYSFAAAAYVMRISTTGSLGIGTSPSTKVHVLDANAICTMDRSATGAGKYAFYRWNTAGTIKWQAGIDGDVSDSRWSLYSFANSLYALNVEADGRVWGSSLHNNAGSLTGTTTQYIASGTGTTWTPSPTAVSNCSAPSANSVSYTRLGNVVDADLSISVTVTTGGGLPTALNFTIPIASSLSGTDPVKGWTFDTTDRVMGNTTGGGGLGANTAQTNWNPTTSGVHVLHIRLRYVVT